MNPTNWSLAVIFINSMLFWFFTDLGFGLSIVASAVASVILLPLIAVEVIILLILYHLFYYFYSRNKARYTK